MKRALLVSPYFLPCNLAGVHRARLLAKGLPEFGWQPTVLTVHPRHYGSLCEPELSQLIPANLRIEYVNPLPEVVGVGDLSLRAFWPMRRRIRRLLVAKDVDLVFVSVLPGYAGLLGGWAKRRFHVPFVLDYQDPWVSDWGAAQPPWSKSGIAHRLAERLEPRFAPLADAVTAVSHGTLDGLRKRGLLGAETPTAELPIGSDPSDHEVARRAGKSHLEKEAGVFDVVYLGTVPEKKVPALRAVLGALGRAFFGAKVRFHFIGTSGRVDGDDSMGFGGIAARCNATQLVRLDPRRIPYLDALRTMQTADALLMLGSTEPHYTASKLFPYWLADRPIVGMAHEQSTVVEIARELGGVRLCQYSGETDVDQAAQCSIEAISALVNRDASVIPARNPAAFAPYAARGIAQAYAKIFDRVTASR